MTMNGKPVGRNGKPSGQKGADALVLAIATGHSLPAAAKRAGVGTTTAYRRMQEPSFQQQVKEARNGILGQAVGRLSEAGLEAVETLRKAMKSKDEGARIRASLGVLHHLVRGVEMVEMAQQLADLRREIDELRADTGRPPR
jgi:hypothetical protein